MANPYAGVNTYHATTILPSDGDPAVAESVDSALRDLTDDAVYLNTQLGHQAFDDRGKTSTITGNIVLNDGGGSLAVNIPSDFNGGLDTFGNPLTIHSSSSLECNGPAEFDGAVTIGNTGTDQLDVNSRADFFGGAHFWQEQVTIHSTSGLEVNGPATLDGATIVLGQVAGTVAIYGDVEVKDDLTVLSVLDVHGDTSLGNTVGDTTSIAGPATLNSTLDVDGNARFNSDVQVDGNLTVVGDISLDDLTCQDITIQGDCTIGNNSSSDTLTINGLLTGGLAMGANGRILPSSGSLSSTQTIGLATSRVIAVLGGGTAITLTIDDTGMTEGDAFLIFYSQGTASLTVEVSGTAISKTVTANSVFMCNRFPGASANNWSVISVARTN